MNLKITNILVSITLSIIYTLFLFSKIFIHHGDSGALNIIGDLEKIIGVGLLLISLASLMCITEIIQAYASRIIFSVSSIAGSILLLFGIILIPISITLFVIGIRVFREKMILQKGVAILNGCSFLMLIIFYWSFQ